MRTTFRILAVVLIATIGLSHSSHFTSAAVGHSGASTTLQDEEKPPQEMGEMQMMERVRQLEAQLQQQQISDRDAAEKELIKLGPNILDFLGLPEEEMSSDAKERLARIRSALEKKAVESVTRSSIVTLSGTMALSKALETIKKQTGNDVALIDGMPDQVADQKIVLNFKDTEFWEAMTTIMKDAKLAVAPYSGDAGNLRLAPVQAMAQQNAVEVVEVEVPDDIAGIFHIQVTRIDASRNLLTPQNNHCNVSLMVRWEPRLRPISVDLAMKGVKITDEFDSEVAPVNMESVISGVVQPQIPELEFSLPLMLVDRQVETLNKIEGTIDAVLPGRIETFKFENLADVAPGEEQAKAGVIVSYEGSRKNDDVWSVHVNIGFDETNKADESYLGWVFDNEAYLVDEMGTKHDYIGYESFTSDEGRIGVQYLYDVDPTTCSLVYKTPAAIVKMPIKFKLEKIPMP